MNPPCSVWTPATGTRRTESLQNLTLQRLPSLSFNAIPTWIDGLPLYYTMQSSWTDYWRNEGTQGNRLDLFPRLAYPLHWKSYLDVETSAGVRSTSYLVDWQDNSRQSLAGKTALRCPRGPQQSPESRL